MAVDQFAEIAAERVFLNKKNLSENPPMKIDKKVCNLSKTDSLSLTEPKKPYTKEELYKALEEERKKYEPFLRNLAPEVPICTSITYIKDFVLNDKDNIEIPYYNGPVGLALQKYTTEFEINEDLSDKAVYICFGAADYHSSVYINDYCVGMHEGFFSPFEFEITEQVKNGKNKLMVMLKNDHPFLGNSKMHTGVDGRIYGDKLYAATGPGYDEPIVGWHHCPAGMGIYNYVRVEIRNRLNITDVFVRPLPEQKQAELWVEIENADSVEKMPQFSISVYGQNFEQTVIKDYVYEPYFTYFREDLTEKHPDIKPDQRFILKASHGKHLYRIMLDIDDFKLWTINAPHLYQVQVHLSCEGELCDAKKRQFGMRSFTQDLDNVPKGRFYLNGKQVKLRGANTMGFEQQDVIRGDINQLIDDILLAKLCNMNFWRLTQRPVQDEIYEYCDKLGLMTQTDLPLFGCMRRTKFAEGIRQAEEMIKMVRKHPCNVIISYINEPSFRGDIAPHRNLTRDELEEFFDCCDKIVKLNSPDCVIKHIDGDYDPPTRNSISDNHTYTLWYNGHEIEFGKLHRGYWVDSDKEWCCGCGEFGAEGLETVDFMKRHYPKEWIKEPFSPGNIVCCQCLGSHVSFFDTPASMEEWVEETQNHQAFTAKIMTESFRRNPNMITNAIHLFIDAWPSGWMKSIMDCERTPKKAYFAYRDSLEPVLVTLRSDRFTYYENETISIETYISNDIDEKFENYEVVYELYRENNMVEKGSLKTTVKACDVTYVANAEFNINDVNDREKCMLKVFVLNEKGDFVSSNKFEFEVFRDVDIPENEDIIFIDNLDIGEHEIAGEKITISYLGITKEDRRVNFVSCLTGHKAVQEFEKDDFKFWFDAKGDRINYIAEKGIRAEGFNPILQSQKGSVGNPYCIICEKMYEGKRYVISTLDLRMENPVAKRLKKALYEL